jgi:hypothetical protein
MRTYRAVDDTSRESRMMTNPRGPKSLGGSALALAATLACSLLTLTGGASAQLNGNNTRGDFGLLSAYQPDPGSYLSAFVFNYSFSDIVNRDGETRSSADGVSIWAFTPLFTHTTNAKVLGANYGFGASVPLINSKMEFPRVDVDDSTFGLGDI